MQDKPKRYAPVTYFIQAEDGGPIKIGLSTRPGLPSRLNGIQTGNPSRLIVRRVMRGNHERSFHEKFAHLRLVGEWFHPDAELAKLARARPGKGMPIAERTAVYREGYIDGWKAATENAFEGLAEVVAQDAQRRIADIADSACADAEVEAADHWRRKISETAQTSRPRLVA